MNIRDIVLIALFAAIMAILGLFPPIILPWIAVPITAQSLGPMLAGALLGAKRAGLALLLFCFLIAIGLPLLSGGRGGLGPLIGPNAGFIYGWVFAAFIVGLGYQMFSTKRHVVIDVLILFFGGVFIIHLLGALWLVMMTKLTLIQAVTGILVFIPGDLLKLAIVLLIRKKIEQGYPELLKI